MNYLCGIAMNRLGATSWEFYLMTPVEFHHALEDFKKMHFTPMKRMCETTRLVAQVVHNSTPGRKKKDMIGDPKKLVRFAWENEPKIQTVDEMKSFILGLAHLKNVKVTQKGEEVT